MILVFDMDGVITSEQVYWDTAATVVDEIWIGPKGSIPQITPSLIAEIKSLAINSNWDLAYLFLGCVLIAWSRKYPDISFLAGPSRHHRFTFHGGMDLPGSRNIDASEIVRILMSFSGVNGVALLQAIGTELDCRLPWSEGKFAFGGEEYRRLHARCQELHMQKFEYEQKSGQEIPAVDIDQLQKLFAELASSDAVQLGIATGRRRSEALRALAQFELKSFFAEDRIVGYDDILAAQETLEKSGIATNLTKPHPYSILRAAFVSETPRELMSRRVENASELVYVGDGVSDVLAAKAAGAFSVGVLTGIPDECDFKVAKRRQLLSAGCDCVLSSVLDLGQAFDLLRERNI
jgi:phosphoglycolate phosphatase-like HAD superfamily hydrolase